MKLFYVLAVLPFSLAAQENEFTKLVEMRDGMIRVYEELLDEEEVDIEGAIGTFITDNLTFVDATGSYDVKLDAGRQVRRNIEGCEVNPFAWEQSNCIIKGRAEIEVDLDDSSLADGFEVNLIIFEVSDIKKK